MFLAQVVIPPIASEGLANPSSSTRDCCSRSSLSAAATAARSGGAIPAFLRICCSSECTTSSLISLLALTQSISTDASDGVREANCAIIFDRDKAGTLVRASRNSGMLCERRNAVRMARHSRRGVSSRELISACSRKSGLSSTWRAAIKSASAYRPYVTASSNASATSFAEAGRSKSKSTNGLRKRSNDVIERRPTVPLHRAGLLKRRASGRAQPFPSIARDACTYYITPPRAVALALYWFSPP
jgi:hypothetical protein